MDLAEKKAEFGKNLPDSAEWTEYSRDKSVLDNFAKHLDSLKAAPRESCKSLASDPGKNSRRIGEGRNMHISCNMISILSHPKLTPLHFSLKRFFDFSKI